MTEDERQAIVDGIRANLHFTPEQLEELRRMDERIADRIRRDYEKGYREQMVLKVKRGGRCILIKDDEELERVMCALYSR